MTPRFAVGAAVRVKALYPPGHVRTPYYCRGKTGTVARICGAFANPEQLAYAAPEPDRQPLYRVHFTGRELWGDDAPAPDDSVEIEIYEHWLEPARGQS